MHEVSADGEPLTNSGKRQIYAKSFEWEQNNSIWRIIESTIRGLDDPFVKVMAFRPIVRFAFFPPGRRLWFSDFTRTGERIEEGWKAYHIAQDIGWAMTERGISKYEMVPVDLLEHYQRLLKRFEYSNLDNSQDVESLRSACCP